jgi:uncharacterized protein
MGVKQVFTVIYRRLRQESNPQPTDPKSGALSIELLRRVQNYTRFANMKISSLQKQYGASKTTYIIENTSQTHWTYNQRAIINSQTRTGKLSQMSEEFFDAIQQGDLGEVERLLSLDSSLVYEKDNGLGPVMVAAYNKKSEIADFLSEKTGSLNIFEAAALGKINQIMRHLARDPLLVNAYSSDGFQPLGLACFFGHYETVKYLINAGAVLNSSALNLQGSTPLHSATTAGHLKVVILLLNHNANPNSHDNNGFTPLHIACQNGNTRMIRSLLFNGADMTISSHQGELPLDLAIRAGHTEAITLLKEGITRRFRAFRLPVEKN